MLVQAKTCGNSQILERAGIRNHDYPADMMGHVGNSACLRIMKESSNPHTMVIQRYIPMTFSEFRPAFTGGANWLDPNYNFKTDPAYKEYIEVFIRPQLALLKAYSEKINRACSHLIASISVYLTEPVKAKINHYRRYDYAALTQDLTAGAPVNLANIITAVRTVHTIGPANQNPIGEEERDTLIAKMSAFNGAVREKLEGLCDYFNNLKINNVQDLETAYQKLNLMEALATALNEEAFYDYADECLYQGAASFDGATITSKGAFDNNAELGQRLQGEATNMDVNLEYSIDQFKHFCTVKGIPQLYTLVKQIYYTWKSNKGAMDRRTPEQKAVKSVTPDHPGAIRCRHANDKLGNYSNAAYFTAVADNHATYENSIAQTVDNNNRHMGAARSNLVEYSGVPLGTRHVVHNNKIVFDYEKGVVYVTFDHYSTHLCVNLG